MIDYVPQRNGSHCTPAMHALRSEPHWVYRAYDADDRLLYVGLTARPEARLYKWKHGHGLSADRHNWWTDAVRFAWQCYPDYWSGAAAEREGVQTEDPIHNRYLRLKVVA